MANDFLEKNLEDIIMENLDKIESRGLFKLYKNTQRQFYIPNCGKMDIFSWEIKDNTLFAKIIELKKDCITLSAVSQAAKYHSEVLGAVMGNFKSFNIEVVLIGNDCCEDSVNISILSDYIKIYVYEYEWDGIKFFEKGGRDRICKSISTQRPLPSYYDLYKKLISVE